MILVQPRGLYAGHSFQLLVVVNLQITEINFENKTKVAGDKILLLRYLMIKPRIQTLLEDNNLDMWNLN